MPAAANDVYRSIRQYSSCGQPFSDEVGDVYVKAAIDMDIYEEIRGYDGPVLLVHGTADKIVNISYARKAHEVYKQCEYLEIEGAGHMFSKEHDRIAMDALKKYMIGKLTRD